MTVRVGVIGAGNIGTAHARLLAGQVAGATVSTVFDAHQERARTIAQEVGAEATASAEELISRSDVDAVVIASPDSLHPEQVLACLAAGKPTLCEKPLAPRLDQARALMEAEVALGRRLVTVGFMRRFDPGYRQLKGRLDAGEVGVPLLVHCAHRNLRVPRDHTTEMSLTNSVVHDIDVNRWLLGEECVAVSVLAGRSTPHAGDGLRDPLMVSLRMASGVIVSIETFSNTQYGYEVRCEVVATEGTLELGDGTLITRARGGMVGRDVPEQWLGRFADAYRLELQAWVDSVHRTMPVGASMWDGYAATAVGAACVQALDAPGEVRVDVGAAPDLYH